MERTRLTEKIAYSLFEHRGHEHGRDREDWSFAERLIESCAELVRTAKSAASAAPVTKRTPIAPVSIPQATPGSRELVDASLEGRVLELLARAVEKDGRALTSAALGYQSTSVVSSLLNGRRALDKGLAQRIVEAFGEEETSSPAEPRVQDQGQSTLKAG